MPGFVGCSLSSRPLDGIQLLRWQHLYDAPEEEEVIFPAARIFATISRSYVIDAS